MIRPALCSLAVLGLTLAACSQEQPTPQEPVAPAPAPVASATLDYACEGGGRVSVRYVDRDVAEVIWQGETHVLRVARSASGARYTGEGLEWWSAVRGETDGATLSRSPDGEPGGEVLARCSRPAASVLPPPAETAPDAVVVEEAQADAGEEAAE